MSAGHRFLVVDDDLVDQAHLTRLLAVLGADADKVKRAANGAAGLAALQADQFDYVLLDLSLPDMTGLDFLSAVDAGGEPKCAVVVVTGQGNEAVAVEAMRRGAHDYLVKGQLNEVTLRQSLANATNLAELRRRLAASLRDLTVSNLALKQEAAIRQSAETELRAAKEAAEQANEAKTRFVAMVTHELRTPLNGILGYAQLLEMEEELSPRQRGHVAAMTAAGKHLLEMIERVLDFASIEAAQLQLNPGITSVRDLTNGCIAFISPLAAARGLQLRVVHTPGTPSEIVADSARLRQVMLNLLGNAVKYTNAGYVELRLKAGRSHGSLHVEIADTGIGIPEARRIRLFQDFERLDASTSVEGTGLGLSIAARIVRLMGGVISHAPNPDASNGTQGSIFWFEIPSGDLATQPPPQPPVEKACVAGKHILVVDDVAMNREIMSAFLVVAGHEPTLAISGLDAVRLAAEQAFDVILMDLRMPDIDGLEASRRIRTTPGPNIQTPILALTAYTFPEHIADCRRAGMNGHIAKPVNYETLARAIEEASTEADTQTFDQNRLMDPSAVGSVLRAAGADSLIGQPLGM